MLAGSDAALLAPARDGRAYAAAVQAMAALPEAERRGRGEAALRLVRERYALAAVVDRLEEVYAAALSTSARR
jgi:glycosyltransferase involved in cell wall biosynthesis